MQTRTVRNCNVHLLSPRVSLVIDVHGVEPSGDLFLRYDGVLFAKFVGIAKPGVHGLEGREYDVECFIQVETPEYVASVADDQLRQTTWDQPMEYLGFWWELGNIFFRRKRHQGRIPRQWRDQ